MHANGFAQEKETVPDRRARFFADMQKAYDEAVRKKMTGELGLTVNLNDGNPVSRVISIRETSR
jgi:hypothetical protein